ncbi:hypothetical protein TNIN_313821 [Trichonephila inaurata madagascariensis]|uniref:Uncharacterized protein n=1 Tax=Trichonephila inaurata madagascariensis TaxID=2747483 RepID=A0A8X7BTP8_9ARAC|nr:hypothetical protein TNIN_313821 [Trichonephila inaurata madagascariensis]
MINYVLFPMLCVSVLLISHRSDVLREPCLRNVWGVVYLNLARIGRISETKEWRYTRNGFELRLPDIPYLQNYGESEPVYGEILDIPRNNEGYICIAELLRLVKGTVGSALAQCVGYLVVSQMDRIGDRDEE